MKPDPLAPEAADLERRFGGLRRLYGDAGYSQIRQARVAVVGLGGVGSWAVEALARSGVAQLLLFDLDQVAESNINRQVQATSLTVGMAKVQALRERIHLIHPGCEVVGVEEFVSPDNWPGLLPSAVDVLIDACDQVAAKATLAAWSLQSGVALVCVGAAGGKRLAQRVEVEDLADTSHDPLLASLRQRLRKAAAAPRLGRMGVRCVFSRESVARPSAAGELGSIVQTQDRPGEQAITSVTVGTAELTTDQLTGHTTTPTTDPTPVQAAAQPASDGTLNCHGYGSSVTVTATFGLVAAGEALALLQASHTRSKAAKQLLES